MGHCVWAPKSATKRNSSASKTLYRCKSLAVKVVIMFAISHNRSELERGFAGWIVLWLAATTTGCFSCFPEWKRAIWFHMFVMFSKYFSSASWKRQTSAASLWVFTYSHSHLITNAFKRLSFGEHCGPQSGKYNNSSFHNKRGLLVLAFGKLQQRFCIIKVVTWAP